MDHEEGTIRVYIHMRTHVRASAHTYTHRVDKDKNKRRFIQAVTAKENRAPSNRVLNDHEPQRLAPKAGFVGCPSSLIVLHHVARAVQQGLTLTMKEVHQA